MDVQDTIDNDVKKLAKLIKDIRIAMLTTAEPDGSMRSRPMAVQQIEFDGDLWFFTKDPSGKTDETDLDSNVNVSFADTSDNKFISVSGKARVVHDKNKAAELWNPMYKIWFPKGLEDPELALLKVSVEKAEIWNAPGGAMVYLGGFVRRIVTGQPYQPGEHQKLDLAH